MALILPSGVNKVRRYVSLYENLTVNSLKITPLKAGVGGCGVNFGPASTLMVDKVDRRRVLLLTADWKLSK